MSAIPRSAHRVVVVGAGIGGLVSALLLAQRGLQVTLVEAAAAPGGKMRQVAVAGAAVDSGPTVFTMRWVFEQILEAAGASLADLPALTPLGVLARHAWRGSAHGLDLHADRARSTDAIGRFAGAAEARRFEAFCAQARAVYAALEGPYIRSARPSLLGLGRRLGPRGLATLMALGPFASLWHSLGRHFHDPRLRQLFGRYATYCGASPWQAPATLMLVAQVELDGVWSVDGGLHALAQAFAALAQRRGVVLRCGVAVERIVTAGHPHAPAGSVSGVRLADGRFIGADSVVFNGDPQALVQGLLGPDVRAAVPPLARAQRSLSALTWSVHAPTEGFDLVRHNLFFDTDYASEFDDVFTRRRLPQHGTVYVCAQDRGDDARLADANAPHAQGNGLASDPSVAHSRAPASAPRAERLLCLVNAPADGDQRPFDDTETLPCLQRSLTLLRDCGLRIEAQPHQRVQTTPADFQRLFPATGGALYGQATHGWLASFRRPGSTCRVPGLYLAGGGVHPGPGVPMAALSGLRAAETLLAHLDSTSRSRRAATSGGTSTPSATTAATR